MLLHVHLQSVHLIVSPTTHPAHWQMSFASLWKSQTIKPTYVTNYLTVWRNCVIVLTTIQVSCSLHSSQEVAGIEKHSFIAIARSLLKKPAHGQLANHKCRERDVISIDKTTDNTRRASTFQLICNFEIRPQTCLNMRSQKSHCFSSLLRLSIGSLLPLFPQPATPVLCYNRTPTLFSQISKIL